MRGGIRALLVGVTFTCAVSAQPGSTEEPRPWRVGPGLGFGVNVAHDPGPGAELFIGVDKPLSSLFLFRAEAAAVYWRHPSTYETPSDRERELLLQSEASLSSLRFQVRAMGGLAASDVFAVYVGVVAGQARTATTDTLCGEHSRSDFIYGIALQPTLYVAEGGNIELSLHADLGISPNLYCTRLTSQGAHFHEATDNIGIWTALRTRYRF
jgi:hypothetical protein